MTDEPYLVTTDQDKDIITALHSICFGSEEWAKLQVALDDKNHFALLAGCDVDEQPTGYAIVQVQDNWAKGLWYGVRADRLHLKRNRFRKKGLGRILIAAAMKEARARGAETMDGQIAEGNVLALQNAKNMGFVLIDSNLDWTMDNGERIEFTNHHIRASLMTIGK